MKKSMFRVPKIFGVFGGRGFLEGFLSTIWWGVFGCIDISIYVLSF